MKYFVVVREPGPAWDGSRRMREQDGWDGHASFMDALASDGFIVLGGPVGDGMRFMHVVDAPDEAAIRHRLAEDPWVRSGHVRTVTVEPWKILLRAGKT
jgi:uncharacterized protein YciI